MFMWQRNKRSKLDMKSQKVIFMGYPEGTKGYKFFDFSTGKFIRSRDVIFIEEDFYDFEEQQGSNHDLFYPDGSNLKMQLKSNI